MQRRCVPLAERLPQMFEVARSLITATNEGRVDWGRHETTPGQFDTTVAGSYVSIASADPDGSHPFVLVVWDMEEVGQEWVASAAHPLESLTTRDLVDAAPDGWVRFLTQLWRVARTNALNIDDRLDALLAELDTGDGRPGDRR